MVFEYNATIEPISVLVDMLGSIRDAFVEELESDQRIGRLPLFDS